MVCFSCAEFTGGGHTFEDRWGNEYCEGCYEAEFFENPESFPDHNPNPERRASFHWNWSKKK